MRRISSVTIFPSGDGTVVSYTYSEIDDNGIPVKQNVRTDETTWKMRSKR